MEIYKLEKSDLTQVTEIPFLLEKDIQQLVESNIADIFDNLI